MEHLDFSCQSLILCRSVCRGTIFTVYKCKIWSSIKYTSIFVMSKIFRGIYSSFHDLESKKSLHFELRTTDYVAWLPSCICYLYLSMILLASSRLSSTDVVLPSTLGLSSLFKAMNAKYITPIVAYLTWIEYKLVIQHSKFQSDMKKWCTLAELRTAITLVQYIISTRA